MADYYFEPMMRIYSNLIIRSTDYLMSKECRNNIATSIKSCRKLHGKNAARNFHNALIHAGVIYPQLPGNRPINIRELTIGAG